jgi:alpha-D-ribose 1-methylphosphonate 5-triphosphate diphosphatase
MWIANVHIVTEHEVVHGAIELRGGRIARIAPSGALLPADAMDGGGCWLLPGLIDLHGDAVEKAIQPRKQVMMAEEVALAGLQPQLLAAGITTMYHAISMTGEQGLRANENALRLVRHIRQWAHSPHALLRHKVHLRWELVNQAGAQDVLQLMREGAVDLLSFMDHTPQYGKYRTPAEYRYYVEKTYHLSGEECDRFIEAQRQKRALIDDRVAEQLLQVAQQLDVPVASHDDDTPHKVAEMAARGITISEFPLNIDTARAARQHTMQALVGAPNALRGYSHENHLSAREALLSELVPMICSDYYPQSMLAAIFILFDAGMSLPRAVATGSLNPAKAVGLDAHFGSIEIGKHADLILVERLTTGATPLVRDAFVDGKKSLSLGFTFSPA